MSSESDLYRYLQSLTDGRRAAFDALVEATGAVAVPESNNSFVFRAGRTDHPVFDDAEKVFWKAAEAMHLRNAASDSELPLVFWGFHSIDLLGRRNANGVLITDRTVYVVDIGVASWQLAVASLDRDTIRVEDASLRLGEAAVGLSQIASMLETTTADDAAAYVSAVIGVVQAEVAASPLHPNADPGDSDTVNALVLRSRLSGDFLLPSRHKDAKPLAKLAAKWKLPGETLLASLSSATFLGVYGIAITDRAVYSRDLMEELNRTPLEEIDEFEWDAEGKKIRVAEGHLAPTLPSITEDNRAYALALLGILARAARQTKQ